MKILAIRGQNLASLAGAFEVDLSSPPLAGAGLFAITGPTGAGKSTLLDAMCLALYDETPRLGAKSSVLVGDPDDPAAEKLSASDVRSILRKGTVAGHAEVDFLGQDGRHHRARWSVRRAHANVKKSFMPQTMTLEHLDTGERGAGTKKEILAQIEALIGLSFEQFRRSALLPQGDFAAFLQSKGGARAELLEKVTGTELYGRISTLAFERAKTEKNNLDQLVAGLAGVEPLSAEERAAIEAELAATLAALRDDKARLTTLRDAETWYRTHDDLTTQREEARGALTQARASWDRVKVEHAELLEIESVQALRAQLEAVDRAERQARAEREDLTRAELTAATADEDLGRTRAALAAAQRALADCVAEAAALEPAIARARALDADLVAARSALTEAAENAAARETDVEAAREAAHRRANELAAAGATLAGVEARLARQARYDVLTDEWPRWREAIRRASARLATLAMLDVPGLAAGEQRARAAHEERLASFAAAEQALDQAQARAVEAEEALATLDPETVRRDRAAEDDRKRALSKLEVALHEVERAARELDAARAHEASAKRKQSEADAQALESERARAGVAAKLEAARAKLEAAQAERAFESYRAHLVDGKECPLCGALDHPFGKSAPPIDERIEQASAEVARWTTEHTELDREITRSLSRAESEREAAAQHAEAATARAGELAKAKRAYTTARKGCPDDAIPTEATAEGAAEMVSACMKDVDQRLRALIAVEAKITKREKEAKEARAARDQRLGDLGAARKPVDDAKEKLDDAIRKHAHAVSHASAARKALDDAVEEVSPAFDAIGPFRKDLERDPTEFEARQAKLVEAHGLEREARRKATAAIADLRPKVSEAEARLGERDQALTIAREAAAARKSHVEKLSTARHALLGGEVTRTFVEQLAQRTGRARAVEQAATVKHQQATNSQVEAATLLGQMRERRDAAEVTLGVEQGALAEALGERSIEALRALLAHDAGWIAAQRARFGTMRAAVDRAAIVLEERETRHARHLAGGAPEVAAADLPQVMTGAQQAIDARDARRVDLEQRLRADDQVREQRGAKEKEAEQQRTRTAFWQRMSGLIGSADGKKLRVFAQSLIFDALLEEANHYLGELSRRYSLAPAAQGDLELQIIDHDMADEVRSSSTLSGGESFLVSLALSLGLSALGASKTRVETVFIDEGFGTLDNRSLDMALASLEALQATGRQIGVISHVDRLAAKIGARVTVKRTGVQSVVIVG